MKALTAASIAAVTFAGVACSDNAPAVPEEAAAQTAPAAELTEVADTESAPQSEFNLRYPGSQPATSGASGSSFNLRAPTDTRSQPQPQGFQLPEGAVREDAFSDIPEVRAPGMDDNAAAPDTGTSDEANEDDIIRLD